MMSHNNKQQQFNDDVDDKVMIQFKYYEISTTTIQVL